jgi:hypothetical protein
LLERENSAGRWFPVWWFSPEKQFSFSLSIDTTPPMHVMANCIRENFHVSAGGSMPAEKELVIGVL